ncbi:MAG TPA: ester cyclase [Acidobacteriaceae bacterium]|jgi:steroid delta-isomerase-like uncharacterized protein|nr:ester cyclase [Acidobacteriaceae bacterium]
MTEAERELGQRWFDEVWNKGRREAIGEMLAPDVVIHDGGETTMGSDAFYPFFDRLQSAFSDTQITVEDTIAEGDKLCVRWACTARHTGDGLGIPATGVKINVTGISVLRVAGSRMVETWQNWDMLGMMQQLKGERSSITYIAAAAKVPELIS